MTKTGLIEAYCDDQLVVATAHLNLVREQLKALDVSSAPKNKKDPSIGELGLTLINVDVNEDLPATLDPEGRIRRRVVQSKWPGAQAPDGCPSALDVLCGRLREEFRRRYAGWVPDFGKNRMISPVRGLPYLSGGGDSQPYLSGGAAADPYDASSGHSDPRLGVPRLGSAQGPAGNNGGQEATVSEGWRPRHARPGEHARVGLLDTKLYPHSWLAGGYDAPASSLLEHPAAGGSTLALAGHATFVAGLILRQAPGANLIVRPVLGERAIGTVWGAAEAMAKFIGSGAHILNLSFGCYTDDSQPPLVLARAVRALSPEVLLVAAAGNHGNIGSAATAGPPLPTWMAELKPNTPVWPAAFDDVVAVGATDVDGCLADFTPKAPWVDVTAPGIAVRSTYLDWPVRLAHPVRGTPPTQIFNGYALWDGTSFATATVSGSVAAQMRPGRTVRQAFHAALTAGHAGIRPFQMPAGSRLAPGGT